MGLKLEIIISGEPEIRIIDLDKDRTPLTVLKLLNYYPDEVIIISKMNNSKPIPVDSKLEEGDVITVIPVASGG